MLTHSYVTRNVFFLSCSPLEVWLRGGPLDPTVVLSQSSYPLGFVFIQWVHVNMCDVHVSHLIVSLGASRQSRLLCYYLNVSQFETNGYENTNKQACGYVVIVLEVKKISSAA